MEINLNGAFFTNRAVILLMVAQGNPNASAYSASKAAVIGFTKSPAKGVSKHNIFGQCGHASCGADPDLRPNAAKPY